MKKLLLLSLASFLLLSCSSAKPIIENKTFENIKLGLLNEINNDNLDKINKEAIEQGIYKPMYRLRNYNLSRVVYPFKTTKLTAKAIDLNNLIFLNERIKANDKNDLINQNFTTKEEAVNYLSSKGYTFKNSTTLPITGTEKMEFFGSFFVENLMRRKLFVENADGSYTNDLAVSLEPSTENGKAGYLLTIKNDVFWKDIGGNDVRKVVSDDVINHDYYPDKKDTITEVVKKGDNAIFFVANSNKNIDDIKKEIINRFNIPSPGIDNYYNQDNCIITEQENGYSVAISNLTFNYQINNQEADFDYVGATSDVDEIYYIQDRLFETDYTYGFTLNNEGGNDAYKKALDNEYFRKALLAILSHDKIKELSHYMSLYKGAYDKLDYCFNAANQTNPNLEAIDIKEGLEESKALFELAKQNGLANKQIEIYTIDETRADHKEAKLDYLEDSFKEVFGEMVTIECKQVPEDYYSTYNYYDSIYLRNSKNDFYKEIQLDGFYFPIESDYIKEALSQ